MKNLKILAVALLIVGLGAGFFGGMQYQKSQSPKIGQERTFNRQNGSNRPVTGDIISSDNNGITVKMTVGSSKIVLVSGSTMINKTNPATKSDLAVGQKVLVMGTANSDGSVTAQNIQLNPQIREVRGGTPSATPN